MALVGNPNSGTMALFNRLTGTRQEVANCAGVTVERKAGLARLPDGRSITIIDLPGAVGPAIPYSVAGWIGQMLQPPVAPIGFNRQIAIALVPGRAEREVAVGALGTVYALSAAGDAVANSLVPIIAQGWSLATADALLAWYVFAPQCISTLAVKKRETDSWRYPLLMLAYMFALAYVAAFITYRLSLWLGAR